MRYRHYPQRGERPVARPRPRGSANRTPSGVSVPRPAADDTQRELSPDLRRPGPPRPPAGRGRGARAREPRDVLARCLPLPRPPGGCPGRRARDPARRGLRRQRPPAREQRLLLLEPADRRPADGGARLGFGIIEGLAVSIQGARLAGGPTRRSRGPPQGAPSPRDPDRPRGAHDRDPRRRPRAGARRRPRPQPRAQRHRPPPPGRRSSASSTPPRRASSCTSESRRTLLQFTHAELGGLLAERWRYPLPLVMAIVDHDNPDADGLPAVVQIADRLAREAGVGVEAPAAISDEMAARVGIDLDRPAQRLAPLFHAASRAEGETPSRRSRAKARSPSARRDGLSGLRIRTDACPLMGDSHAVWQRQHGGVAPSHRRALPSRPPQTSRRGARWGSPAPGRAPSGRPGAPRLVPPASRGSIAPPPDVRRRRRSCCRDARGGERRTAISRRCSPCGR